MAEVELPVLPKTQSAIDMPVDVSSIDIALVPP
jgi:hypothetical protein